MRAPLFLIPLALSSAACSSKADYARETGVTAKASAGAIAQAHSQSSSEKGVETKQHEEKDGGTWDFAYGWPAAVGAQPALAAQFAAERDKALAEEKASWQRDSAASPPDCTACRSREYQKTWKVVADLPGWLSLSADSYSYTGGAHGMSNRESLVWDKTAKLAHDGVELFRSPEALDAALGPKLCAALNAQRAKKRGEPVRPPVSDDTGFSACQNVSDAAVLVGSSNGKAFDRIGIWFGPYVAGPYAEGAYELNFPVDAAVMGAVKPEFAGAFAKE